MMSKRIALYCTVLYCAVLYSVLEWQQTFIDIKQGECNPPLKPLQSGGKWLSSFPCYWGSASPLEGWSGLKLFTEWDILYSVFCSCIYLTWSETSVGQHCRACLSSSGWRAGHSSYRRRWGRPRHPALSSSVAVAPILLLYLEHVDNICSGGPIPINVEGNYFKVPNNSHPEKKPESDYWL